MKAWRFLIVSLLVGAFAPSVEAQTSLKDRIPRLPHLSGAVVRTVVSKQAQSGVLHFEYRLDASAASLPIDALTVDLHSDATRASVSIDGLDNSEDTLPSSAMFRQSLGERIVAIAFPSTPDSWFPGIDAHGAADWGVDGESALLKPGNTLGGFVLLTRALPGIREAKVDPALFDELPSEAELDALGLVPADMGEEEEAAMQHLKVVGPVAPPKTFDPREFAGEIDGLLTKSRAQGWVATDEAEGNLSSALRDVETALDSGDLGGAARAANQFIQKVDSLSCPSLSCPGNPPLSSEAYALLHFNMEYLRSKLPNRPPTCEKAAASPARLWPPNHKMSAVAVAGVEDPDLDPFSVTVSGVTQDEDVLAAGSGKSCPDAQIEKDGTVLLRSERAGSQGGRTYRVDFTATDALGASCTGVVKVCVPHDANDKSCTEGSGSFDSTTCP